MTIKYHDKWLRLIAYPVLGVVIRLFGDMAPLGHLLKRPLFYADVLWDILIVAVTWEANRKLILYLDERYSWVDQKFQRFVIQFFVALPMTFAIVVPLIYIWNEVITDHGNFDTANLMVNDFPLTIIFTTMVHMIYTFQYYYRYQQFIITTLKERVQELETSVAGLTSSSELNKPSGFRKVLIVNYGTSSVPVNTSEVAYIYKQNEISFITTFDGKEYSSSSSLENLESLLDPISFFRLNRQMIANLKAIRQFRSDASGKLILELLPSFTDEVSISKKKAAEFREWIGRKI